MSVLFNELYARERTLPPIRERRGDGDGTGATETEHRYKILDFGCVFFSSFGIGKREMDYGSYTKVFGSIYFYYERGVFVEMNGPT